MGVRLGDAPKVVLVSSLAIEADIVDGQAKIFGELASEITESCVALDAVISDGNFGGAAAGHVRRILGRTIVLATVARTMKNHAAALRKAYEP